MAAVTEASKRTLEPEQRVVLRDVGWEGYEALLAITGDGHVRLACDGKDVELMSPSQDHEFDKNILGVFILTLSQELRIRCKGGASTTWRKHARAKGLEPDLCYYMANASRIRGKKGKIDLSNDPPPDLAVEIEISRSALDRLAIYSALGVPEVWCSNGERLTIELLQPDGSYTTATASPSFPGVTPKEIVHWVRLADDMEDDVEFSFQIRDWVRDVVLPRMKKDD